VPHLDTAINHRNRPRKLGSRDCTFPPAHGDARLKNALSRCELG
jgi:hypothetical protein